FIQELPRIATLSGVRRTRFNQQDSLVQPLVAWLKQQGVVFMITRVTDLDFRYGQGGKSVSAIQMIRGGVQDTLMVGADDLVLATIGSMTATSSLGSMTQPPIQASVDSDGAWQLWENLARRHSEFGRPAVFNNRVEESRWLSFTVTQTDPAFFDYMEAFTGNPAGTGGLVTFTDSPWQMSIVLAHQPHFRNQPEGVRVFWGYGLFVEAEGASVKKPMLACNGADILTEIAHQLRLNEAMHPRLLDNSTCIPCLMPYITSQFMPRTVGDRPPVIPPGTRNFAFLGQFCEIPEDVVFTVEYSVRSAQIAVYGLMNVKKPVAPIYHGAYDPKAMFRAFKMLVRPRGSC
ncbi:MAG: oleate hydratase, partial [Rickettsiales bacterium]|nr:oleate hydratase [Rickettsiales bacterium]